MANQQIAGNFQSFLQLLTTQLQNQNPLSPLDTNQFTQQLVEFAGVQQQINTNDSLATLVSLQQTAQSTQALQFVGKTAVVKGDTTGLTNGVAAWGLNVPDRFNGHHQRSSTALARRFTPTASPPMPATTRPSPGTGLAPTAPSSPTAITSSWRPPRTSPATRSPSAPQIQGVVTSVDLTQSPPLLSIGGQNFTVNQILSILD